MVQLEKFTAEDFERLISWIETEEELVQFAGHLFRYPLSQEQLLDYSRQQKKSPYRVKLMGTNLVIGHCEINFENEGMPRLSRILVGERSLRGKGLGTAILHELITMLFCTTTCRTIDLYVFEWNEHAISCYKRLGFKTRASLEIAVRVAGKEWTALNMMLTAEDYFACHKIEKTRKGQPVTGCPDMQF